MPEATEAYIGRRTPLVAPRTLELEQGAVKHLSRHFATAMLAKLDSDALAGYVARRKAEGAGNRTINIEGRRPAPRVEAIQALALRRRGLQAAAGNEGHRQVGMDPCTCGAFVLLSRFVRSRPVAFGIPPQAS